MTVRNPGLNNLSLMQPNANNRNRQLQGRIEGRFFRVAALHRTVVDQAKNHSTEPSVGLKAVIKLTCAIM